VPTVEFVQLRATPQTHEFVAVVVTEAEHKAAAVDIWVFDAAVERLVAVPV